MSGIIGKKGSRSGVIKEDESYEGLIYINGASTQTIDSSNEAITSLARTYTYNASHFLLCQGGLTMTATGDFHSHIGIFVDGNALGYPDQHYTPDGNWWYMSWSFMTVSPLAAGSHSVTFTGSNQLIDWNIIGDVRNSQNVLRIIPY